MTAPANLRPSAHSSPSALRALGVSVQFGGLRALTDINLEVMQGEILGLIGPNGAGKTTMLNVLSGFQRPTRGKVQIDGVELTGLSQHQAARHGLGRTFQAARLFSEMSVLENVEAAGVGVGLSRAKARSAARELLSYLGLESRSDAAAKAVTYGEARLVGIARALAVSPKFLLLDEPAAGMSPHEALQLMEQISRIRADRGCGVVVIEHNMQIIMRMCDRVQVLARGTTIAVGKPGEVQASEDVREAYLGQTNGVATVARAVPPPNDTQQLLAVTDLVVDYGAARALHETSLSVNKGEFVAVIGPNGAGKSTLLTSIAGLTRPKSGAIVFDGVPLERMSVAERVRRGIALVPEGRRVLSTLTVQENLLIGQTVLTNRAEAARQLDYALETFPLLRDRLDGYAGRLSGGEQQQLVIARALLSNPKILLLDEPSLGLAPMMIETVYETLLRLHGLGLTILLMEQNANRALGAAERAYVMRHGRMELERSASMLSEDPDFDRAYFGYDAQPAEITQ